ncbi:MAG: UDP-N-acetylglucosamine 2-epimerase (non-hydrolyzing) [Planctomycetes bacterium]|nr:UDP-N-acetylglucosamine 2-epimerase (non-hydrolyzing) [Planctomycetota bacterium]
MPQAVARDVIVSFRGEDDGPETEPARRAGVKIVTVIGARPQFIKAAVVSRAIDRVEHHDQIQEIIVHTGQHFDANMSDVFFEELNIRPPDHHLGIGGMSHGEMTGRMLIAIEKILLQERPDWMLVYGDTNSTLAGALAAAKLHIPVAHVESGLRSFNMRMPEEVNRVMTDHVSTVLFAPTRIAISNLHREGIPGDKIINVGDVMYDSALHYQEQAGPRLKKFKAMGLVSGEYVLATVHREENTDDHQRLQEIIGGLIRISQRRLVVLPLHPRTRAALEATELMADAQRYLRLIDPVGYLDMLCLEMNARLIATDSGGVQKEAFFFGVPCLTLRDETEWVELVEIGANMLVNADAETINAAAIAAEDKVISNEQLYGDGAAGMAIVDCLVGQKCC